MALARMPDARMRQRAWAYCEAPLAPVELIDPDFDELDETTQLEIRQLIKDITTKADEDA